jgi:hypothetical protein
MQSSDVQRRHDQTLPLLDGTQQEWFVYQNVKRIYFFSEVIVLIGQRPNPWYCIRLFSVYLTMLLQLLRLYTMTNEQLIGTDLKRRGRGLM